MAERTRVTSVMAIRIMGHHLPNNRKVDVLHPHGGAKGLQGPIGIAIDAKDQVWVTSTNHSCNSSTSDGRYIRGVGGEVVTNGDSGVWISLRPWPAIDRRCAASDSISLRALRP